MSALRTFLVVFGGCLALCAALALGVWLLVVLRGLLQPHVGDLYAGLVCTAVGSSFVTALAFTGLWRAS